MRHILLLNDYILKTHRQIRENAHILFKVKKIINSAPYMNWDNLSRFLSTRKKEQIDILVILERMR